MELALCASHDLERGRKNIDDFILLQTLQAVRTATRQPIILYMKVCCKENLIGGLKFESLDFTPELTQASCDIMAPGDVTFASSHQVSVIRRGRLMLASDWSNEPSSGL